MFQLVSNVSTCTKNVVTVLMAFWYKLTLQFNGKGGLLLLHHRSCRCPVSDNGTFSTICHHFTRCPVQFSMSKQPFWYVGTMSNWFQWWWWWWWPLMQKRRTRGGRKKKQKKNEQEREEKQERESKREEKQDRERGRGRAREKGRQAQLQAKEGSKDGGKEKERMRLSLFLLSRSFSFLSFFFFSPLFSLSLSLCHSLALSLSLFLPFSLSFPLSLSSNSCEVIHPFPSASFSHFHQGGRERKERSERMERERERERKRRRDAIHSHLHQLLSLSLSIRNAMTRRRNEREKVRGGRECPPLPSLRSMNEWMDRKGWRRVEYFGSEELEKGTVWYFTVTLCEVGSSKNGHYFRVASTFTSCRLPVSEAKVSIWRERETCWQITSLSLPTDDREGRKSHQVKEEKEMRGSQTRKHFLPERESWEHFLLNEMLHTH